jgi:hypothetical protein
MEVRSAALRQVSFRAIGWLAVVAMLAVAVLGPSAQRSLAASVDPTDPGDGNPSCTDLGYAFEFKIDTGDLEETTYGDEDADFKANGGVVVSNWTGQEITISNLSDDGQTFDFEAEIAVSAVLVKAGNDNHALYEYDPPVLSDTELTHGGDQQGISHVSFCGNPVTEPSEPPSEPPSVPPSEPPSVPPSEPPSVPPSEPPSVAPSGGVGGATGTPTVTAGPTLPPTDLEGNAAPISDTWRMALIALAGLLASVLVMTPARSARRK